MFEKISEYAKLALRNIKSNGLRSILTVGIIALGITALVGIQTVITGLGNSLGDVFTPFGTNQFSITNTSSEFQSAENRKVNPVINYDEAHDFKENFKFPAKVSVSNRAGQSVEIRGNGRKTNPNFDIIGGDENYLDLNNGEIEVGRNFSLNELGSGVGVAIITGSLKDKLFEEYSDKKVIGQRITANGQRYRIIGLLKDKGQGFGGGTNYILVPVENVKINFASQNTNYNIKVGVETIDMMDASIAEAKGVMRRVRGLRVIDEDDFSIDNPQAADKQLKSITTNVKIGGGIIGAITLLGAAIGLMNILLVSVTERIREIGLSKAIGASPEVIRLQFFLEGMIISLIGGVLGIVFSILVGYGIAKIVKSTFVVPWDWVIGGLVICLLVGLIASVYPAIKASQLKPIDALRQN